MKQVMVVYAKNGDDRQFLYERLINEPVDEYDWMWAGAGAAQTLSGAGATVEHDGRTRSIRSIDRLQVRPSMNEPDRVIGQISYDDNEPVGRWPTEFEMRIGFCPVAWARLTLRNALDDLRCR